MRKGSRVPSHKAKHPYRITLLNQKRIRLVEQVMKGRD